MAIEQNQRLASRYHILKNIGSGAFGVTFLAEDENIPTQPKCVVKQLQPLVNDPNHFAQAKKLFEKEAATLAKVGTHNQIPYLKDYFEEGGDFYLVQDFIDGTPLDQELSSGEPWSQEEAIALLQDCLSLLDFIHAQSPPIIHRDIKPANLIRRREDGKIVLVDFGAVTESFQTKLVKSTVAIGTRGYMPTEQIRGKPRPSSDIFALGMVVIQALIGLNPINLPEDENGELVWQYTEDEAGQLHPRVSLSRGFAEVLSKMIRHDFKDRYQSAREVIEALENLNCQPEPQATSVILPQEFDASSLPESTPEAPIPPTEAETVKQDSTIPEQETVQQQSVAQEQASSLPDQELSSGKESSSASPVAPATKEKASNGFVTWLQSPTAKNLGIASVILILASVGMYGLDRHRTRQQEQTTQAQLQTFQDEVKFLFEEKEYQDCLDKINNYSGDDIPGLEALKGEFYSKCSLALAESFARAEQYPKALQLTEEIDPNTELYDQAQVQMEQWSDQLLAQGVSEYQKKGNLENFDQVVSALAPSNPVREDAIAQKQELKKLHNNNQTLLSEAQIALDKEQWERAREKAQQLKQAGKGYPYWQEQARLVLKDVKDGIAAAQNQSQPVGNPTPTSGTGSTETATSGTNQPAPPSEPIETSDPNPTETEPEEETNVDPQWDPCSEPSVFCTP